MEELLAGVLGLWFSSQHRQRKSGNIPSSWTWIWIGWFDDSQTWRLR